MHIKTALKSWQAQPAITIFDRPPFWTGHEQQPLSPVTPVGEDGSFPVVQIVDHDQGRLEARQKDWQLWGAAEN